MKLKVTLEGSGDPADLAITLDSQTTVGQLADHLVAVNPAQGSASRLQSGQHTLALVDENHRAVDPRATVSESGLTSGSRVSITRRTAGYTDPNRVAAKVIVLVGPDAGREYTLPGGSAYIGRGRGCEVQLSDQSVSRRHVKVVVGEQIEVSDLGSSNGILVSDEQVDRAVLGPGDVLTLGETSLQIVGGGSIAASITRTEGGMLAFSRSPVINPIYEGKTYGLPDLPERGKPPRMPWAMMLIPILMGAMMFGITRSPFSLIFMLMMPLMYVAMNYEGRRTNRLDFEEAMRDFREDVGFLVEDIEGDQEVEETSRRRENPSAQEARDAAERHAPLMWSRRPGEPGFLEFRLGLAEMPSRSTIEMPAIGRSKAEAWLELSRQMEGLSTVESVPVLGEPLRHGAIGVAGPREQALDVARALVAQVAALHSPAEVVIGAITSTSTAGDWAWLKWLPHVGSVHSPVSVRHTAASAQSASALLEEVDDAFAETGKDPGQGQPYAAAGGVHMVLVVENDAPVSRARLVSLAEGAYRRGIALIWVAPVTDQLPAACRTFVQVGKDGSAEVGFVGDATVVVPVEPDRLDAQSAARLSRQMSASTDAGALVSDDSDLPRSVSFLTLVGPELATSERAVVERWGENRSILTGPFAPEHPVKKPGSLRAVLGQSSQGTYSLDLRTDGPHALVGGTTGAGKSETLQAWILGMASAHSPQRVTFLLVDYKGGSAFRDCVNLPHTVGMVTDLSPHLVRRALASLSAELHHRERLLERHRAKDLIELERRGEVEAPPSLIIIVDEFAALVQEVPDFVDGVVNIAQRGRSLGIHLILATQRPAGVIKDNLRANTNLRIALRMADESDSDDVLGTTDAAFFDPAIPGRGMAKSGPGRLVPFQSGYAGGWTSDETPRADIQVETLTFGTSKQWELPPLSPEEQIAIEQEDRGPTDIQRLVQTIRSASDLAEIPDPRKPWLPDMLEVYDLADLPTERRDDQLVFGILDDPDHQQQPTVAFRPDLEGNLAVFGASGSGKSALLRTFAVTAGFTVRGGPCHVYGLDFGNRGLSMLQSLPHVGSIVNGDDHERVARLLRTLRQTIDERAVRYSSANAASITEYRRVTGENDEPRILVLLDGLVAFRQTYESARMSHWMDLLQALLSDGRPVGVHFIISVDQRNGLPTQLGSAVQSRIILRMATADDYSTFDVPSDVLTQGSPPGRALYGGREVQCAVLGGTQTVMDQAKAIEGFARTMRRAGAPEAPAIGSLTDNVRLVDLPERTSEGKPVVGIGARELAPVGMEPTGGFIITGQSGSGRTTALVTVHEALRRCDAVDEMHLYTLRKRSDLLDLPGWTVTATTESEISDAAEELAERYKDDEVTGRVAIFLEKVNDLADSMAEDRIEKVVKRSLDSEHLVVAEGDSGFFNSGYGLPGLLRAARSGLILHPDEGDASLIFRAAFPGFNATGAPEGRGFIAQRGQQDLVQVALPSVPTDRSPRS
jgi:S-DNA-T family DNA segregation ATPase FtsK/SpoIIIE